MTIAYPPLTSRSSNDATIEFGTNANGLPPPPNYGTQFLFMSITSNADLHYDKKMRMTIRNTRDENWNPNHIYTYARYEGGNGPVVMQALGALACRNKLCVTSIESPLNGSFSSDARVDIEFIRDPGLVNR